METTHLSEMDPVRLNYWSYAEAEPVTYEALPGYHPSLQQLKGSLFPDIYIDPSESRDFKNKWDYIASIKYLKELKESSAPVEINWEHLNTISEKIHRPDFSLKDLNTQDKLYGRYLANEVVTKLNADVEKLSILHRLESTEGYLSYDFDPIKVPIKIDGQPSEMIVELMTLGELKTNIDPEIREELVDPYGWLNTYINLTVLAGRVSGKIVAVSYHHYWRGTEGRIYLEGLLTEKSKKTKATGIAQAFNIAHAVFLNDKGILENRLPTESIIDNVRQDLVVKFRKYAGVVKSIWQRIASFSTLTVEEMKATANTARSRGDVKLAYPEKLSHTIIDNTEKSNNASTTWLSASPDEELNLERVSEESGRNNLRTATHRLHKTVGHRSITAMPRSPTTLKLIVS